MFQTVTWRVWRDNGLQVSIKGMQAVHESGETRDKRQRTFQFRLYCASRLLVKGLLESEIIKLVMQGLFRPSSGPRGRQRAQRCFRVKRGHEALGDPLSRQPANHEQPEQKIAFCRT